MKINSVNGKTVITLDEDEALVQCGGKTEIQTSTPLSAPNEKLSYYGVVNNPKNKDGHVFTLINRASGDFLVRDIADKTNSREILKQDMYEKVRNDIVTYHENNTAWKVSFDNYADALNASSSLMINEPSQIVDVVEFEPETASIIKIY